MERKMTWNQIKAEYPDEWVAIAHYDSTTGAPFSDIIGDIVAHAADEKEFTLQIKSLPQDIGDIDIRFTGDVLPDNPVGSVLWQM